MASPRKRRAAREAKNLQHVHNEKETINTEAVAEVTIDIEVEEILVDETIKNTTSDILLGDVEASLKLPSNKKKKKKKKKGTISLFGNDGE